MIFMLFMVYSIVTGGELVDNVYCSEMHTNYIDERFKALVLELIGKGILSDGFRYETKEDHEKRIESFVDKIIHGEIVPESQHQ